MKKDRNLALFAVTAPGLEGCCAEELRELGMAGIVTVAGGVEFAGGLRDLYRANLWLRCASRVLVRLASFRCRAFPDLYQRIARQPWGQFLRPGTPFSVSAASHGSRLFHTERIVATATAAVHHALGGEVPAADQAGQRLLVRIEDDVCQLSVDGSGALLHRRGYRQDAASAPLRETLAAGLLRLSRWDGAEALVDPLCGSGTLPIEAALLAARRPPGSGRRFAFMDWPGYRPGLWQALLLEARQAQREPPGVILGSDRDPEVVTAARANALRAGVGDWLQLECRALETVRLPPGPGLLVANPPYGARLEAGRDLAPLFAALGRLCLQGGSGWRCAFLAPDAGLARATGLQLKSLGRFSNGGIGVTLWEGTVP